MDKNIKDIYGLTPSQEGIYAQYFRNTDTKTYHLQSLSRIKKETHVGLIEKSVELLALRHPILKTAFVTLKSTGKIKQVVLENRKPEFRIFELNEPFSQSELDKIVRQDAAETMDLIKDPLFRVLLIDFNNERFMLLHTHHIILDGWCFPVIVNDLQRFYDSLANGKSAEDLSEEINREVNEQTSYAQYVKWIKEQNKENVTEYWKNLLSDCSFAHIFGKEKKDLAKNENIVTFNVPLTEKLSRSVEEFAKKNRASNNTVFESAFSVAIQKYSDSSEVVFDKVISGRSIPLRNIENTVGPFINTVPVRIKNNDNATFADLMKEIQSQTISANENGIIPLSEIYKVCGIDSKSIDALFVFENYYTGDDSEIENGPLSPKIISFDEQTEFNLTVTILKEKNRFAVRISYAKEMYIESEMSAFVQGYIAILEQSLEENISVKDISAITADEKQKVLFKFNDTAHKYTVPDKSTIYSLFEETAKGQREKVCVTADGKSITFGELLSLSETLDSRIREITNGEKSVIAVIAERSIEMYAGIYGIIRSGNAYMPISPDYPQERIEYMLKNSNAAAVVAQGKFTHLAGNVPCIDMTEFISAAHKNNTVLPCAAEADDTAYVIYTSGSTGNPKGAKISHKSAVNRILWMHDKYPLGNDDVILQKTPYTFDVSVWELFWWGMCGGSLAASKPDEHFLPAKILEEVYNNNVTHLHFVPSVFELFLNYLESHTEEQYKFSSVRYVFLSGEALSADHINRFYSMYDFNKVTLHNLYGPTECAVDVTYYDCVPGDADPVPIGKPIANTQIYIVDKYLKPVPIGVTGELCIAGMNVGQGYLNNPELTAEKFVDNPFGEGKMYKTGDNAFLREDGEIIFCGRMDNQIKLNGQRIEIDEIESVINKTNGVFASAVIVKTFGAKDILVAFYTAEKEQSQYIKEICSRKLPRYMLPNIFVHVDTLPLNKNGKLDKKALAQINIELPAENENTAPTNETERFICNAFKEILGAEQVGRTSDFFELGGSSLSMIALLSGKYFENITAAEFIMNPTPKGIAQILNRNKEIGFKYLEPLYTPENADQIMILLPFAGGGAESFSNFVASLKTTKPDTAVYFIRYLHSEEECRHASDEIADSFRDTEIIFYSHCVGSAIALYLINYLESKNICIKHYFAGASIPPAKPSKNNIWNIVPNMVLKRTLIKAGADFSSLSHQQLSGLLRKFRKDTDFANCCFFDFKGKLKTPISIILSKNDIFTKNYMQATSLWRNYFKDIAGISFIDSESHYFQKVKAEELIEIIFKNI